MHRIGSCFFTSAQGERSPLRSSQRARGLAQGQRGRNERHSRPARPGVHGTEDGGVRMRAAAHAALAAAARRCRSRRRSTLSPWRNAHGSPAFTPRYFRERRADPGARRQRVARICKTGREAHDRVAEVDRNVRRCAAQAARRPAIRSVKGPPPFQAVVEMARDGHRAADSPHYSVD